MAITTGSPPVDAALVTLFGVALVQGFQWFWMERRMRFDKRTQDEKLTSERKNLEWKEHLAIRKEVYLKASEELAQAAVYLIRCGDLALSDADHAKLIENYGPALMKVHLVGTNETISKMVDAQSYFSSEIRRFMPVRVNLRRKGQFIAALDNEVKRLTQVFDTLMREANDPVADQVRRQKALFEAKAISKEVAGLNATCIQQGKDYESAHRELWAGLINAHNGFLKRLLEANIVLRRELGMPLGDENEYRQIVSSSLEGDRDGLQKLYTTLMPPREDAKEVG